MEEQHFHVEEYKKIFFDEDFTALAKKLSLNDEIRKISLEIFGKDRFLNDEIRMASLEMFGKGVQFIDEMAENILEKFKEYPQIKTLFEKVKHKLNIIMKITQDEDFKALMSKHEVKHKNYSFFVSSLMVNVNYFVCQNECFEWALDFHLRCFDLTKMRLKNKRMQIP